MCWSGEASAVLASVGIATTMYAAYKKEPASLWIALGYFSLMELLQAFTYPVINQCTAPTNQVATLLGYLHIAFQPFFINALSLYFIPKAIAQKVAPYAYAFCFFSVIVMIIQVYPFDWAGLCNADRTLCGLKLCSVSGNWHIAWELPTNSIGDAFTYTPSHGFPTYLIAAFIVPLLYGSWRMTIYHVLAGPILSHILTDNLNEWPAVWCLLSIAILLLVVKTPIRKYMFVQSWYSLKKTEPNMK
ncbi:MAG: hypothetical protein H6855_01875 [Rhodospirillales bacterium]|nr:hypothetical protein [Rhodospirillales bacterium]MCB9964813.1 hypothetical protein [Rhodospirillales bacterium]MCB9980480.1 hypothetical protein [Rhodospirillales bacterium]